MVDPRGSRMGSLEGLRFSDPDSDSMHILRRLFLRSNYKTVSKIDPDMTYHQPQYVVSGGFVQ